MQQAGIAIQMLKECIAKGKRDRSRSEAGNIQIHCHIRRRRQAVVEVDEAGLAVVPAAEMHSQVALPLEFGKTVTVKRYHQESPGQVKRRHEKSPAYARDSGNGWGYPLDSCYHYSVTS